MMENAYEETAPHKLFYFELASIAFTMRQKNVRGEADALYPSVRASVLARIFWI